MTTITAIAVCVPTLMAMSYHALRSRHPEIVADVRGIALQTVIIIVVLLAIAGAIAGVLVSRGDEAATLLAEQEISADASGQAGLFRTESSCKAADFEWESGACGLFEVGDTATADQCAKSGHSHASGKCSA